MNPPVQLPGTDSSIGELLLLIYKMASIDENDSHRKITMTHTQTTCLNRIALRAGKEVGALASMVEKSATEIKLKQKLSKCKRTM